MGVENSWELPNNLDGAGVGVELVLDGAACCAAARFAALYSRVAVVIEQKVAIGQLQHLYIQCLRLPLLLSFRLCEILVF